MNSEIVKYNNGNMVVKLYDDGTKIREYPDNEKPKPEFPESIDLKITSICKHNCPFCYDNCNDKGRHCKISDLEVIFDRDYPGVEVAIGGGNPLLHPELTNILYFLKSKKMIANITINQSDIKSYFKYINRLISDNLLYGIGISVNNCDTLIEDSKLINGHKVYHTIVGVFPLESYEKMMKLDDDIIRILVLGFKNKGRGVEYYSKNRRIIREWALLFGMFFNSIFSSKCIVAFDNLAIEQLRLKEILSKQLLDKHYLGDDGQFSMYIDATNMRYAKNSLAENTHSIDNQNLINIFKSLTT